MRPVLRQLQQGGRVALRHQSGFAVSARFNSNSSNRRNRPMSPTQTVLPRRATLSTTTKAETPTQPVEAAIESERKHSSGEDPTNKDETLASELPLTELMRDFVRPSVLFDEMKRDGYDFYCGVPDSLLKDFCAYISDHVSPANHIITPNEGNAIAVAAGYHLGTGKIPVVYMQNSGLGNAINPLMSLVDRKVFEIPMLIFLGWRGEPGRKDEPQHMVQGKATTAMLADLGVPFEILPDYEEGAREALGMAATHFQTRNSPYCFLVRKRTFTTYKLKSKNGNKYPMTRQEALRVVCDNIHEWDPTVCTTGFASRELYELRKAANPGKVVNKDFLMVGSMGHASSVALGVALSKPSRKNVFCLDGDGAILMHMGVMSNVGQMDVKNFKHILLNNGVHDSVGQQPTTGFSTDFPGVAKACGYKYADTVSDPQETVEAVKRLSNIDGPAFLEIRCQPGTSKDLGRPKETPRENKLGFMQFLRS